MNETYLRLRDFKKKYPSTVAWRLEAHAKVITKHLNPDEYIIYAFPAQKNDNWMDIISTCAVVLTNKRILIGQKRVFFGYSFVAITPDMFNDLTVYTAIIWGKIFIDTVKEVVKLSNISKHAVDEIETNITEYMMTEKQKYSNNNKNDK